MNNLNTAVDLRETLSMLAQTPNMRPFLFRTRFERSMVRLSAYAKENQNVELFELAEQSLEKLYSIVDKSNTTPDGELRSHSLLLSNMQEILSKLC